MEIRTLRSFPEDPLYIESIATAIEKVWSEKGRPNFAAGERLLFSYHSIPVAMRDVGDPYISECEATSRALVQREAGAKPLPIFLLPMLSQHSSMLSSIKPACV